MSQGLLSHLRALHCKRERFGRLGEMSLLFALTVTTSLALLAGCAAPRLSAVESQSFVPQREIQINQWLDQAARDFSRGRFVDAEGNLRRALYHAPGTKQIMLNLGRVLLRNGQLEEAARIFTSIESRWPRDLSSLAFIGESYIDVGDWAHAKDYFERVIDIDNARAQAIPILGAMQANAKVKAAEVNAVLAARVGATVAQFYFSRFEESVCGAHDLYVETATADTLVRLARFELAFGRIGAAEKQISAFLEMQPGTGDARVFLMRAIARFALGDELGAAQDIQAAQKRDETVGEYALELSLMAEIAPQPRTDDIEEEEEDDEESDIPLQVLTAQRRLYIPHMVLNRFDSHYQEKRLLAIERGQIEEDS
jgi:tetratricopeptide (TPR) repeat protein